MCRFLPYTALALYLSVLPATAAKRYDEWPLEQPRSSVFTLSFKQSVPRNSKIATSELGFICDHPTVCEDQNVVLQVDFYSAIDSDDVDPRVPKTLQGLRVGPKR